MSEDPADILDEVTSDGPESPVGVRDPESVELAELADAISKGAEAADGARGHRSSVRASEGVPPPTMDDFEETGPPIYEEYTLDVDADAAQALLRRVYAEIEAREQEGFRIDQLILGLPQYRALEPWAQATHGQSIEDVLSMLDVIVVPGPMIHPVIPNEPLLIESLADE